jgi:hypothetical protein
MRSPLRNFHLPLPEDLHRILREEATTAKRPATALARQAIKTWLHQRRKAALHEAIATYAAKQAGSGADLDASLETAALEALRAPTPRMRRKRRPR